MAYSNITSPYGKRDKPCATCSEDHKGIDLRAPVGSPIYANQDLQVSRIIDTPNKGYGKAIYVKDPADPTKEYIFGHLDDNNPNKLKPGSTIQAGEVIGYTGNTGDSTGAHLHYEVRENNKPIPPTNYAGIASFDKNNGNLLTTTAKEDRTRPTRPGTTPPSNALTDIQVAQNEANNRTGPGSNPRPAREDVGILINPRHMLGDGA